MALFDTRTAAIAAGGVALVTAGIAGLANLESPAPVARAPLSIAASREMPMPASVPAARGAAAGMPIRVETWHPEDSTETVAHRYREAWDLREFHARAADTGGMAQLWFAQTALLRCAHVMRVGLVGAEQQFASMGFPDDLEEARRAAHRRWIQPCAGFETRPLPPGELQRVHARLRESPGLVGDAYRIAARRDASPEELRNHLRAIVASGDANLIGVFGSGAADLRFGPWKYADGDAAAESNRRLAREQRAWMLAGCELGMDCGRGSLTWYHACLGSGDCSDANSVSGAAAELGKAALPALLPRRDEIVAAVRARDWPALGL